MKNFISSKVFQKNKNDIMTESISNSICLLNECVFWFATFFTVMVLVKLGAYLMLGTFTLEISLNEILLCGLGFVNVFFVKVVRKLQTAEADSF